jgi:hypothetical protein
MRGQENFPDRLVEEIRLALLCAEPERAADLLAHLLQGSSGTWFPHARQLAHVLGSLRDSWPESLEQGGETQTLWRLAQGPFFHPRALH